MEAPDSGIVVADAAENDLGNEAAAAELDDADPEPVYEKLSALVNGVIQQTQTAMEELVPAIASINTCYMEVTEEIQHARDLAVAKKARLEEEKERFQQAACSVLDLLNALN